MRFQTSKLKNGLTLITAPLQDTKAVTVLVLLKVGSRHEAADINGVSHFIEHLMFKGTKRRPTTLVISQELDNVGAQFNAFTGKDYTGYYIKVTSDHFDLAVDMLADMLFHSTFDPREIKRERGTIIEEIKMYEDTPSRHVGDVFDELLYDDTPLGRNIAGTKELIATVPRARIMAHQKRFYQPDNMVVAVAGQTTSAAAVRLVSRHFGATSKRQSASDFVPNHDQQSAPRVRLVYKDTAQVHLMLGVRAYPHTEEKKVLALSLLSTILGGGMSSRLFINIRERQGLCYYIRTGIDVYDDTGSFAVHAGIDKNRIEFAITAILKELKKFRDEGPTTAEMKKAKEQIKGNMILQLEDSEEIAAWLGEQYLHKKKIMTLDDKLTALAQITRADIMRVARELLRRERLNLALIGPFKQSKKFLTLVQRF